MQPKPKIAKPKKPRAARTIPVGLRVPAEILAELDSMRRQPNGIVITRSHVMLAAIMHGLDRLRRLAAR